MNIAPSRHVTWSICIFAQDEPWRLADCVGALDAAAPGGVFRAHIMVNGDHDETLAAARSLAAADRRVTTHYLSIPDKANAWNDYVYRIAGAGEAHVFIDGDAKPSANAISALCAALQENPEAYGAAALPVAGRSRRFWAERLIKNRYLSSNLYALSAEALALIRAQSIHLPLGLKGEDGLISYLLHTDFEGGADDSRREHIVVVEDATFEHEPLSLNWADLKKLHMRLSQFSERRLQGYILYDLLKEKGVAAMPDAIYEICSGEQVRTLTPRINPIHYWYDRAVLKRLRNANLRAFR